MRAPDPPSRPAVHAAQWFVALALLVFLGEALGYSAYLLAGTVLPRPAAWGVVLVVALAVAAIATLLLQRLVLDRMRSVAEAAERVSRLELANKVEQHRKLRHDIRGALSPVLLVADRLINHADPAVKRSGEIMVRTVERATAVLAEAGDADLNPPADP